MKFQFSMLVLILAGCIFSSCILKPEPTTYYFNSFETPKDTTDWQGVSYDMFKNEPGPNGGRKSLYISGGSSQPTASLNLRECKETSDFKISFWAKINENNQSGSIILSVMDQETKLNEIVMNVAGNNWTFYESDKSITCPAGNFLKVEIMIGGIVLASMNVDLLKIEKI